MNGRSPRRVCGFTLLEMLITLVIVAMIAAILGQALGQLSRVERMLEGGQLRSMVISLRAEWVRNALTAILPGSTDAERMRGSERELTALSSDVPQFQAAGVASLRLRLVTDDRNQTTRLELQPEDSLASLPVVLLQWPGREGRFRYLDGDGNWQDRWPLPFVSAPLGTTISAQALAAAAKALPRAIALDTGTQGPGFMVAVPLASKIPEPTRVQFEAM